MIDNIEYQLENMSFRDVASRFLNSADLDGLMAALEEQSRLSYEGSKDSLIDSFEDLRNADSRIAFIFVEQICNIIKSKAFSPADIPKLVHSLTYSPEVQADIQSKYTNKGMMSWTDFGINVHSGATAKKPDGSPAYNIGHIFDHEISHSLVESGAISISQIEQLFDGINTSFESSLMKTLRDNDADPQLILKERFCEAAGCYLQSLGDPDHMIGFLDKMTNNSKGHELKETDADVAQDMFNNYMLLYERLENLWPVISNNVREISLEDIYDIAQNGLIESDSVDIDQTNEQPTPAQIPRGMTQGGDSGSDETLRNMRLPKHFEETEDLGKINKPESFTKTTHRLLKDFADSLDIFNSGMAA